MSGTPSGALVVESLAILRGRKRLVDGLSFALPAGCYLELAGPNGSGKTSLLRTLAGLQQPAAGEMHLPSPAFFFSDASGFRPELSVAAQLDQSLQLASQQPAPQALRERMARIGLARQAELPVARLSQGQVRRLTLGIMEASERPLWLIDEPFNALDADAVALFRDMLQAHLLRGGCAVIATHRSLQETLPELDACRAGSIVLGGRTAQASVELTAASAAQPAAVQALAPAAPVAAAAPLQGWRALRWVLQREFALVMARPQDAVWPSVFHWMVVSLFPFGLGTEFLRQAAAGIFWISALFAMLIGAGRLFEADAAHGALAQMRTAGLSLSALVAGKLLGQWLTIGLPVAAVSLLLGLQYGLSGQVLLVLAASLALGLASLSALSCLFAALGLMARQAQVVMSLLALPIFVPLVIFGSAAVTGVQSGAGATAPFIVLTGMALVSTLAVPFVAARLLTLALE